jgi:hypothetical protein
MNGSESRANGSSMESSETGGTAFPGSSRHSFPDNRAADTKLVPKLGKGRQLVADLKRTVADQCLEALNRSRSQCFQYEPIPVENIVFLW